MEDNNFKQSDNTEETTPQIHVNDYGETKDSTVVVEEATRTVLLTENETIVIEKEKTFDVPPKNRERKVYAGMWGTTELVTVGVAMLAILTTILLFVFLVLPAQRELANNRANRDDLDKQLTTAKSRFGDITTTEERVAKILTSVDDFEIRLPNEINGKTALYQQLNGLIAAYGLKNTTGPDYAPLEISDPNKNQPQTDAEKGRAKFISIYPGQYITMTLDGPYQNLRRFIREIETNRGQFIIISAVELEPSDNKEKPDQTQPTQVSVNNQTGQFNNPNSGANPIGANPNQQFDPKPVNDTKVDRGKMRGETVTLRLEMVTYFRRPNYQPQPSSLER